jgi:hypothetical protein
MITIESNLGRKARLWLEETPPSVFSSQEIHEITLSAGVSSQPYSKPHLVAIEFRLFRGTRPIYGFLGAIFSPENTQELLIQTVIGEDETSEFQEFLAVAPEIVQIGLSDEYAPIILERALQVQKESSPLPPGRLTFNCAAHGIFTSNSAIFGFLSQTIVTTIGLLDRKTSEEEIVKFVESAINSF